MSKIRAWRRIASGAVVLCGLLVVPGTAGALSTHSAHDTTLNSVGLLVATAKCGADEHVVSGGFAGAPDAGAIVSRAVHGDRWRVVLYPGISNTLTTQAYCAKRGHHLSTHSDQVTGADPPPNTTAKAECAPGQTLIAGGHEFISDPLNNQNGSTVYDDFAASSQTWKVTAAFENTPGDIKAYAYCEQGADIKVRSALSPSIGTEEEGTATARCHRNEDLLSGGYKTTPAPDWNNSAGPDLFYYSSRRSAKRAWTVSAHNYSSASGKIEAFVYCAS